MSSNTTDSSLWDYDDFTRYARGTFNSYPPLIVGAVSLSVLLLKSGASYHRAHSRARKSTDKDSNDETQPLIAHTDVYGSTAVSGAIGSHPEVSLKARHFDLVRLPDTNEDGTPHGRIELIYKSPLERARVALEYLLVIGELGLAVSLFFVHDLIKEFHHAFYVSVIKTAFWAYIFVIVSIRVYNLKKVNIRLPNLWVHSTTIYFFNFLPSLLTFRSVLVGTIKNNSVRTYYALEFTFSALLLILNFTSTAGDKPAQLYYTSDGVAPSPENVSSLFSFITYSWINKMVWSAYKNPLEKSDIWGLRQDDYALNILKGFEANRSRFRFTIKIFSHFKMLFAIQGFWAIVESFLIFAPSLLLKRVLEYVDEPANSSKMLAWTFIFLMPVAKLVDSIASGNSLYLGRRVCVRMKAIIIGEVYAKALRRKITVAEATGDSETDKAAEATKDSAKDSDASSSSSSNGEESKKTAELGAIINLMAIDAFKVSEVCGYLHFFVSAIFMIFICIGLLYNLLGWSALIGALAVVALFPLNYTIAKYVAKKQKDMLSVTDKRIQKINETFQSVRIIKFFAWEEQFYNSIMKIRNEELAMLKSRFIAWSLGGFVWFITPTLISLLTFYCYTVVQGNQLTAPIAFTSLSLFTLLRSPLDQLSDMTAYVIQSKVSLDRVADFLDEEETSKYDQLDQESGPDSPEIGFENASFSWNPKSDADFKLRDINVDFKVGRLNVIVGPTGSGKTSLLYALLGEMTLTEGKVFLPGIIPRDELVVDPQTGFTESVAYCSQAPWLLNDTIRNNITFSAPFNQNRYDKVVDACGLSRDFEILSAGDSTEVGEKGITLSGGQKQRVSLARALYSNSKTVLLDDCLSAVDSHTALWIYENCITGPLMLGRTCLLVSHNVALTIQSAGWIIVMDNGRIKRQGTPEEVLNSGDLGDDDLVKSSVLNSREQSSTNLVSLDDKNTELKAKAAVIESKLKSLQDPNEDKGKQTDGKLVEEESKAVGVVGFKVYAAYCKSLGGPGVWILMISAFAFSQLVYMFQSWWLKNWSLDSARLDSVVNSLVVGAVASSNEIKNVPILRNILAPLINASTWIMSARETVSTFREENNSLYYISIYALIGFGYAFVACFRVLITFLCGIRASNRIFKGVLTTILQAKLRFFDKTPIGRIMNRFSKDIESVDQEVTPVAEGVFMCIVQCVSTLILIILITPGFLIFAILISLLYYVVGLLYITLSRELQRFNSTTKSPIHQHFSESLNGVATIRAYGVESRFMKQNLHFIDENNRPFFYLWVANRWLALRIDLVGSLVSFFSGIFVLLSVGRIDAGLAGLSMSYAIAFSESALWIVRLYSNVEMNMNSVERLQEYLEVEQEPAYEIPETEPPASWPEKGRISVKDVSLRYDPSLPRVIKNVSFDVEPNNKIGIVGRTGAGKSTIITAFFRFIDPETGSISIDGIDITTIGLKNLRQAITIIPQDPTLFTGTIRSNLDPFDEYTDEEVLEALRRVNLIGANEVAPTGEAGENQNKFFNLEGAITEGGGNLSQGERQLVCLSRSLLKNPKVILLDEATSSIDYKSDSMIQTTIREEFSNSTILTIAHRLRTIIDYDKILVMDAGKVVEYENPYVLITDKSSLFYSMCENSGELDSLIKLAKEAYVIKKNQSKK